MLDSVFIVVIEAVEERMSGADAISTGESPVGATVGTTVVVIVLVRGTPHCGPQAQLFQLA